MVERKLVVIESPLRGETGTPEEYARNRRYAIACWHDSRERGEAPYASHIFIAQPDLLDDTIPEQREQGIAIGLAWGEAAVLRAVYVDFGVSSGMQQGITAAALLRQTVERRTLPADVLARVLAGEGGEGVSG